MTGSKSNGSVVQLLFCLISFSLCLHFCRCGCGGNLTVRLRFFHRPMFRISSSRFCSIIGCGWNLPEARGSAEKTQIRLFQHPARTHTCCSEAVTAARWGLLRNGSVHTAAAGQTLSVRPWGPTEHVQPDRKQVYGLLNTARVSSHRSGHATPHSAFRKKEAGWRMLH